MSSVDPTERNFVGPLSDHIHIFFPLWFEHAHYLQDGNRSCFGSVMAVDLQVSLCVCFELWIVVQHELLLIITGCSIQVSLKLFYIKNRFRCILYWYFELRHKNTCKYLVFFWDLRIILPDLKNNYYLCTVILRRRFFGP